MKRFILDFIHRGSIAAGIGPLVLAIVYLILGKNAGIEAVEVGQIAIGIFSITALAFIAGGLNALYQVERLPLMWAILIHGAVLYLAYLCTFILNDWLDSGIIPLIVFTIVFIIGYLIIWAIIYSFIRRSTAKINRMIAEKQNCE